MLKKLLTTVAMLIIMAVVATEAPAQEPDSIQNSEIAKRVSYYVDCYAQAMHPGGWSVTLVPLPAADSAWGRTRVDDYLMMVATIGFNLNVLATLPDSIVRRVVVHELGHLLSGELRHVAMIADPKIAYYYGEVVAIRIDHQEVWYSICPYKKEEP